MTTNQLGTEKQTETDATPSLLAQVASIICEETCGLTSQCKSREAAKVLLDRGYLKLPSADQNSKI
jgi:hypothetical protein